MGIASESIPFEHREFREVARSPLFLSKAAADLENVCVSGLKQSFHLQLRGCDEKLISGRFGIDLIFRGGRRDAYWCFNLNEIELLEQSSDRLDDVPSLNERSFFSSERFGANRTRLLFLIAHFLLSDSILHAVLVAHTLLS